MEKLTKEEREIEKEKALKVIDNVLIQISYAEDWEGNKYEPSEVNCKINKEGILSFETHELFGFGDVPIDLEPVYVSEIKTKQVPNKVFPKNENLIKLCPKCNDPMTRGFSFFTCINQLCSFTSVNDF